MTGLAQGLGKYYRKQRGKIIFQNGMSLNQLSLEMYERLEYKGIDASVLSRVVRGERLFTYRQLQAFCQVLQLEEKDRRRLEHILSREILERHAVKAPTFRIPQMISREEEKEEEVQPTRPFYRKFPYVLLIFYGAVLIWWMKLQFNLKEPEIALWGIFQNFIPLISGVYYLRLGFNQWRSLNDDLGKSIVFFSLGLLSASFGMGIFAYYNHILKISIPYPSWADIGFFSVIPFYILGTIYFSRSVGVKLSWSSIKNKPTLVVIPFALLVFCYFLFLKNVTVDFSRPVKTFLDFAYPLGEIVPITIALFALKMVKVTDGRIRERILYLIFALVIQYLTDYSFLYTAGKGLYYDGSFIDLIYTTAYVAMGLTLYSFKDYNINYAHRLNRIVSLVRRQKSETLLFLNKLRVYLLRFKRINLKPKIVTP